MTAISSSRLYLGTYNVGTNNPDARLNTLLGLPDDPKNEKFQLPDLYILSFQEVKAQPQNMLLDALFDDPWTYAIKDLLERYNYVKIKSVRLQGLLLNIYCLRKHLLNIREIESEYTRTGLSGMWVCGCAFGWDCVVIECFYRGTKVLLVLGLAFMGVRCVL